MILAINGVFFVRPIGKGFSASLGMTVSQRGIPSTHTDFS